MNLIATIAQAATAAAPTSQGTVPAPSLLNSPVIPMVALGLIVYFYMIRPKNKNPKREDMLKQLKKGDEIQTIGGEFGRVVDVREDRVLLKVDETSNTKIWYSRASIHRIVTEEKAETK